VLITINAYQMIVIHTALLYQKFNKIMVLFFKDAKMSKEKTIYIIKINLVCVLLFVSFNWFQRACYTFWW